MDPYYEPTKIPDDLKEVLNKYELALTSDQLSVVYESEYRKRYATLTPGQQKLYTLLYPLTGQNVRMTLELVETITDLKEAA